MGRTATFETGTVVRAARDLFWENGFDAASLPDLERATGLARSSIYHAFGSKRGLFDAAVQDYLDDVVRPSIAGLVAEDAHPDALVEYLANLDRVLARLTPATKRTGCLLLASTTGSIARDETVRVVVDAYRAELRDAVRAGLGARYPDLAPDVLDRRAVTLVSLVIAAHTLARVNPTEARATVGAATDMLDAWDGV
ncbi:TetR/AcrR family transcriptional regulator [Agromyces atrinae]|uniref:TetR/AcrR family transcriptional regulator n=1 Tax=Agromyces atrinae TaxID=592376 RepID=UPI001F58E74C|nr:TetR/AcrR family transcriptional regulator [Agromyces atrinae]MCI2959417.1 TetR/AcrR family transcriptional regulator [Agromyces atrinae]